MEYSYNYDTLFGNITIVTKDEYLIKIIYGKDNVGVEKETTLIKVVKKQIDELDVDYLGSYVGDNLLSNLQECLNDFSEAETFFLMLEESTIDPAGHANNKDAVITAVKRFDDSIKYAMVFTVLNPDTVLIITADHETGGLTKKDDGTFEFTTGGHSSAPVPVFAIGDGTEIFNDKTVDNTDIAKFMASVYGETEFGE